MFEIIAYNVLFWGVLVSISRFLEHSFQYVIDNQDKLNKKG